MSASLLVKPSRATVDGQIHRITPASAGWRYVGFEVFDLAEGQRLERALPAHEQCVVLLSGRAAVSVDATDMGTIGARATPFEGGPHALYAPPRARVVLTALTPCELAIGSAPAEGRVPARLIGPDSVGEEVRGSGTNTRYIRNVLPASAAEEIDRPPVGNDTQPHGERPARVVSLPRAMNGQQHVLHHVVDAVGRHPAPSRDALDDRYAVAQQRLVGVAVAGLSGGH